MCHGSRGSTPFLVINNWHYDGWQGVASGWMDP
jgi:hypothetical protein